MLDSPLFIDRTGDINSLLSRIKDLDENSSFLLPIIYIYGVPWVGKTSLIRQLKKDIQNTINYPILEIDFAEIAQDNPAEEQRIRSSISLQLGKFLPNQQELNDKNLIETFSAINDYYGRAILLVDGLEKANNGTLDWLLYDVVEKIMSFRPIIIFSSRVHIANLKVQVPKALKTREYILNPLELEHAVEHINQLIKYDGGTTNFQGLTSTNIVTNGIPGLNEHFAQRVNMIRNVSQTSLLQDMVEEVVFRKLFKENITPDIVDAITIISIAQDFDEKLFCVLLENLNINRNQISTLFEQSITYLNSCHLIIEKFPGLFYIPSVYRRLMDEYHQTVNPLRHLSLHLFLYSRYLTFINNGRIDYLSDLIYHLSGAWNDARLAENFVELLPNDFDGNKEDRAEQLERIVIDALERYNVYPSFYGRFRDRIVKTIATQTDELLWHLSKDEVDVIINVCKSYNLPSA